MRNLLVRASIVVGVVISVSWPAVAQEKNALIIAQIENNYPNFRAVVTALDGAGNPLPGLEKGSFTISEDGLSAEVTDVKVTSDVLNVVIALDTSGSMAFGASGQRGIDGARTALISFLQQLREADNVALLTFDDVVRQRSDFTYDKGLVRNLLVQLDPPRGSTVLYEAIKVASELAGQRAPSGQRILLLVTDGENEPPRGTTGPSLDDAIALAQQNGLRIYTIGFGQEVKPAILDRIANETRGRSQISPSQADLTDFTLRTSRQLTQQYEIRYRSKSPPGDHTVVISLADGTAMDSRTFTAPGIRPVVEAPRVIQVKGPGIITFSRAVLQSEALKIARVEYYLDRNTDPEFVATDSPWSWTWDTTGLDSGSHAVLIRIVDSAGQSGDSQPIDVRVEKAAAILVPLPRIVPVVGGRYLQLEWLPIVIVATVAMATVAAVGLFSTRRPKLVPITVVETAAPLDRTGEVGISLPTAELTSAGSAFARLVVVKGEPDQLNREFEVRAPAVIGRDPAMCQIPIKDSRNLVSRSHAEIRYENDHFVVYDRGSKYHTYVNGKQVTGPGGQVVQNNDVINLGPTVILRFVQQLISDVGPSIQAPLGSHPEERTGNVVGHDGARARPGQDHPDERTGDVGDTPVRR